jgi:hypothetical protein
MAHVGLLRLLSLALTLLVSLVSLRMAAKGLLARQSASASSTASASAS